MRSAIRLLALATLLAYATAGVAQDYPNKTIHLITGEAGGGNDTTARMLAQALSERMGQSVIVENHGGNGVIPVQTLVQARPDGYTLLLYGGAVWLLPYLKDSVPYDPVKDLAPVAMFATAPNVLVVPPDFPANSMAELLAMAKAKPGDLNYGTSGIGSANHLAGALLENMASVKFTHVPYKGTGPALSDVLGGRIQMSFPSAASATGYVKSGRLKALGVTSAEPTALFPGVQTIAATVPGYEAVSYFAVFAPAKTPPAVINYLNAMIGKIVADPAFKERLFKAGAEGVGGTPQQLADTMAADMKRMGKLIKDANIRTD
jgi:tripartite-type tricarboxylate transporter receptor subunit TctC